MTLFALWSGIQPQAQFSIFELIMRVSPLSKTILLLLLFLSIATWAIFFIKLWVWHMMNRDDETFIQVFHRTRDILRLSQDVSRYPRSGLAQILAQLGEQVRTLRKQKKGKTLLWRETLFSTLERAIHEATEGHEKYHGFLATTAGVAPFIGLFGTVLGIIAAFEQIGAYRTADLSVVAPGIAEALVATAAGLAAAIPALIFYNYFSTRLRKYRTELQDFGSYLIDTFSAEPILDASVDEEPTHITSHSAYART